MSDQPTPQDPNVPPRPSLLAQLIPTVALGVGSALTSPIRSAPLIAGRAILGANEGYQSAQPPPVTQKDLYYRERLATQKLEHEQLTKGMQNQETWLAGLPEEDRGFARIDPKGYVTHEMARREAARNLSLFKGAFNMSPEGLAFYASLPPKEQAHAGAQMVAYDHKQQHPNPSYDFREVAGPDGKPLIQGFDKHTGKAIPGTTPGYVKPTSATSDPVKIAAAGAAEKLAQGATWDQLSAPERDAYQQTYQKSQKPPRELSPKDKAFAALTPEQQAAAVGPKTGKTGGAMTDRDLAAFRRAYDNRLFGKSTGSDEYKRMVEVPFEDYVKESLAARPKAAAKAETAAPAAKATDIPATPVTKAEYDALLAMGHSAESLKSKGITVGQ